MSTIVFVPCTEWSRPKSLQIMVIVVTFLLKLFRSVRSGGN